MATLAKDFPEVVTLKSIGKSYEGRDIMMIVLDSRDYIKNTLHIDFGLTEKPAIFMNGAHHSRELVSI